MRFYAPYKNFRVMMGGRVLRFPNGSRTVEDGNLEEIKAIKSIPIEKGEIRDVSGDVVNKPLTPTGKPKATRGKQRAATTRKSKVESQPRTG